MSQPQHHAPRAILTLLIVNFLMWGGFFMIIPLISVHFSAGLGWAAGTVGVILAVRQITQQGLTVFGGALADRLGPRGLILAGLFLRFLGFAAMGFATTFWTLLGASILAGVGGALFDAPKNAALTTLTAPRDRTRIFSLMGVSGNLGMVVGPLVGALLARLGFREVALVSSALYLLSGVLLAFTLPALRPTGTPRAGLSGLGVVLRDARFTVFTALAAGYYLLSAQLNIAVALKATAMHGAGAIGWVYGLNAGLAVALQVLVFRLAERRLGLYGCFVAGVALAGLSLGAVAFAGSFPALLACVAVFSVGNMLASSGQQALTATFARPDLVGSYFGVGSLSIGLGGAIGTAIGGALYDAGNRLDVPTLPWLTFGAVGLVTVAGLLAQRRRLGRNVSAPITVSSD